MSTTGKLATIARMPPRRWGDIVVAVVVATRVEWLIRNAGLERAASGVHIATRLDGTAAENGTVADVEFSARELEKLDTAWRVLRSAPFNGTCLRRALVGGYFLRDRSPLLRVGVQKIDGVVSAHAWIEVDGVSLDPDGSEKYAVLKTPGGGGER